MQCPKCNSDNTQRLEVIYSGGTQNINMTSTTVGGGYGGAFGVGGAATETSGQSQSLLAQNAAPPFKRGYKWAIILILIGLVGLTPGMSIAWIAGGILMIAAGGYIGKDAYTFNSNQFPLLYQEWLDSWLCNKCGMVYHQP